MYSMGRKACQGIKFSREPFGIGERAGEAPRGGPHHQTPLRLMSRAWQRVSARSKLRVPFPQSLLCLCVLCVLCVLCGDSLLLVSSRWDNGDDAQRAAGTADDLE